jgi:hypothetical protein
VKFSPSKTLGTSHNGFARFGKFNKPFVQCDPLAYQAQYRAALQLASHAHKTEIGRSSFGVEQAPEKSGRIDENEVKYQMAQCHLALNEPRAALQEVRTGVVILKVVAWGI